MGTYHDHFATELRNSFPKTPASFRRAVEREVYAQSTRRTRPKGFHPLKAMVPVAACLVLVGGTVAASELPAFQNWLSGLRDNGKEVEESIIHMDDTQSPITLGTVKEDPNTDTDQKPLFTVTDVFYDGLTLMFWAQPEGEYFDLGDHVYINGIDSRLEYVAETSEGSGIYECKVTVVDGGLQQSDTDVINVEVGVYTSPESKTDFSFTVDSDKLGSATRQKGSIPDLSFGRLVSYDVTVAATSISLHLDWEIEDDTTVELLRYGDYVLEDASGKRLTRDMWLRSATCDPEEYDAARKCTVFSQDLEITGFDADSPTMTLIPVRTAWDAEGNWIPDSDEILEDMAFTISLSQ